MNEPQNEMLIQKVYDAFGRGDLQTILSCLTDDIDWTTEGPEIIPFTGKRKGHAQARAFFEALASYTKRHEADDRQDDCTRRHGRDNGSLRLYRDGDRQNVDAPIGHFFTIRDGKVCRYVGLLDTAATADAYRTSAATAG